MPENIIKFKQLDGSAYVYTTAQAVWVQIKDTWWYYCSLPPFIADIMFAPY